MVSERIVVSQLFLPKFKKLFRTFSIVLVVYFYLLHSFKGWVQCFSMQVVMNKCFLLNPEKKKKNWHLAQSCLFVFKKNAKNASLIPKNIITEPKARLL